MKRAWLGPVVVGVMLTGALGTSCGQDVAWPQITDGGSLFVLGEKVDPPYLFTLEDDTLRVNGIPVSPVRRTGRRVSAVSAETRERHDLLEKCFDLCDALVEQGVCASAVRDSVLGLLRGHPRVEAARRHEAGEVRVRWKGRPNREEYIMIPTETSPPAIPWTEVCGNTAKRYAGHLATGSIVLVSAAGEMILPADKRRALENEIEILRSLEDPESEEIQILSAEFAREFLKAAP